MEQVTCFFIIYSKSPSSKEMKRNLSITLNQLYNYIFVKTKNKTVYIIWSFFFFY